MGRQSPLAMIRAYHGSPHKFDRFDLSKIGTGEGAQAYGHGLYFADREGTARAYRDALSQDGGLRNRVLIEGEPIGSDPGYRALPNDLARARAANALAAGPDKASWLEYLDRMRGLSSVPSTMSHDPALSFINGLDGRSVQFKPSSGSMYEVGIHADPSSLLDWDKPLQAQPHVLDALRSHGFKDSPWPYSGLMGEADHTMLGAQDAGSGAYRALSQPIRAEDAYSATPMAAYRRSPVTASKQLSDAGIPGIRYLDQGSRAAGDGSSNYVIFNPDIIQILRRYGIAAPAAFSALGQEE